MNNEPYTVIGVLTPDFWQPLPCDIFYVPWPVAELRAKEARCPRLRCHRPLEIGRFDHASSAKRVELPLRGASMPRRPGWPAGMWLWSV